MTLRRFLPVEFVRTLGRATAHQHSESIVAEMEGKASPKRQKALNRSNNYLLEAIERAKNTGGGGGGVSRVDEDGVLRVKIVVRKQDLKQMLGMINGGGEDNCYRSSSPSSTSVEERLNLLRRKHLLRSNAVIKKSGHCWSPELQSIPEE
ncbi:hypothetical protein HRI_004937400 [Hibiscus trionum]|uniref:Uncharacterized protein n=1 Tax=Hibiscus trionum TaxID=183268 RepID=A0A9W7JCQ4_HIBTR|nr:hypothetical protein HRI_004937400 [Hibiscus trionum]